MREKALSLGQSVRSSASTVQYSHEGRPKFLMSEINRTVRLPVGRDLSLLVSPVHRTNTARQTTHSKAEIRPDSKNSRMSQNLAQNWTKIAQCMPGLRESRMLRWQLETCMFELQTILNKMAFAFFLAGS